MQGRTTNTPLAAHGHSARAVVSELLVHGPMPRAELARRLQLSPAALTRVTRELLEAETIRESGVPSTGTGGRPGTPLEVNVERHQLVGMKVTGDGVYGVRTDALGRVQRGAQRTLTTTDVHEVTAVIIDVVNEVRADAPVEALGVGLAGAMSRFDDRVRHNAYLGWEDVPLAALLEHATGLPTVLSNDVRALTAGVHWSGHGRGQHDIAVVTTGVGIGLGLVIEGRPVAGARGRAGMIGHLRVDDSGPICARGHRGCADSYLTTAAITGALARSHSEAGMTLARVCELADDGDAAARRVLADAGRALGAIVADLVNTLDIGCVILAGDGLPAIIRARTDLERTLAERLDPFAHAPDVHMLLSDFDEWARGAAVVACQWLLLDPPRRSAAPDRRTRPRPRRLRGSDSRRIAVGA